WIEGVVIDQWRDVDAGPLDELFHRRTAQRAVETIRRENHRVTHRLGVEARALHPPEILVVRIYRGRRLIVARRLAIDSAGYHQALQALQRAAIFEKRRGQPVEQLRMRRQRAHPAEVARRSDQTPAEVLLPDAIDDRPPGEDILRIAQPACQ